KAEIAKRFDLIHPYLRSGDELFVRLSVAAALSQFPEIAKRVVRDLRAALRDEENEHVRKAIKAAITEGANEEVAALLSIGPADFVGIARLQCQQLEGENRVIFRQVLGNGLHGLGGFGFTLLVTNHLIALVLPALG